MRLLSAACPAAAAVALHPASESFAGRIELAAAEPAAVVWRPADVPVAPAAASAGAVAAAPGSFQKGSAAPAEGVHHQGVTGQTHLLEGHPQLLAVKPQLAAKRPQLVMRGPQLLASPQRSAWRLQPFVAQTQLVHPGLL